ncbi:hypothetical protein SAMN04488066_10659 [Halorubrum aquaticum]|uniref:Uncharacterized protein n=1 Tax=Halorubrum aquaticum TaxID=387340 RepID=A0A1I3AJW5_9EURY|nr:hypothetical protein SAMN04488066_10659 [Halorubrum aquaticum]
MVTEIFEGTVIGLIAGFFIHLVAVQMVIIRELTSDHLDAERVVDELAVPLVFKLSIVIDVGELIASAALVREQYRPFLDGVHPRLCSLFAA